MRKFNFYTENFHIALLEELGSLNWYSVSITESVVDYEQLIIR